jgi:MoxR-like ATPase
MTVKPKITALLERLNDGVYEKEEVIALSLLSAVAGESIFLLGAPGVAKSLVARRLKYAFKGGSSFEYLMNRFSTPDEIFGPVSISQLKDNDRYERIINNYLPTATVVFLDEIWKAGPSIQNALLTVLNEKIYRNGDREIQVPMKALISASNELPGKGDGLEALWDRFLVRLVVEGIKDKQFFNEMISKNLNAYSDTVGDVLKISDDEYRLWSKAIDEVNIPENVLNVIHVIRNYIGQHNQKEENKENTIYISDRRWRKTVRLLRTAAFLNDRNAVDLMDCFLIKACIWNEPEQIPAVSQFVCDAIQKHGYKLSMNLSEIGKELKAFDKEVKTETSFLKEVHFEEPIVVEKEYYNISGFENDGRILITDYNALSHTETSIYLYTKSYYDRHERRGRYIVKKGRKKHHIIINNAEYGIQTASKSGHKAATRKPHPSVIKDWDKKVALVLTQTSNLKSQIEHYKKNELKHIRVNLFVNPSYAEFVESNLNNLSKEIEKQEIEVKEIQHYYEHIEDQTGQKPIKTIE